MFVLLAAADSGYARESYLKGLSQKEIQSIGESVFKNECASKDEELIAWNEGEDFMSLGIGHFIWHPAGAIDTFEESFIKFLKYAKDSSERLPLWLDKKPFPACPWKTREDFMASAGDRRLKELREFLIKTKPNQAAFIIKRLDEALPLILKSIPKARRDATASRYNRVASTSAGIYALADYVNFKGLGILDSERYQGKGWGLLQVLEGMKDEDTAVLEDFVRSASSVLKERVKNAPPARNEQRWLPGWQKRINSYLNKGTINGK
jgi:hypothetical protein